MSWGNDDVSLVDLDWLKPHEEIKIKNRDKLLEMTKKWGGFTKPLLVDSQTGSILDGHHRHSVAVCLNLKRVPAILIDYLSNVGDNNIYGARPIKRKIQTQIENELSKLIISDDIIKGGSYTISFTDGRLISTLNQKQIQSNPSS